MASPSGPLRRILAGTLELARARIELAGVELAQERLRLEQLAVVMTLALFSGCVGALLIVGWLVLVTAPAQRPWLVASLAAIFLLAAALLVWRARRLAARGALLQSTLAELAKDAAALRGSSTAEGVESTRKRPFFESGTNP